MFTGIIEELGHVAHIDRGIESARMRLEGPRVVSDAAHGASIAVNGVCLTVVDHDDTGFSVDVMSETLDRSSLGALTVGDRVNLERAMAANARFGGHIVQGHVDGTGTIVSRVPGENSERVRISLPAPLQRYIVEKGSITVDGVSLTVASVDDAAFEISLIPTTLDLTTLGIKQPGDPVNLEVDVLAKYVEKLMEAQQ